MEPISTIMQEVDRINASETNQILQQFKSESQSDDLLKKLKVFDDTVTIFFKNVTAHKANLFKPQEFFKIRSDVQNFEYFSEKMLQKVKTDEKIKEAYLDGFDKLHANITLQGEKIISLIYYDIQYAESN